MGLTLKELLMWPPEISDLAKATHAMADAHSDSADFYRSVATLSSWQGQAADTAMSSILLIAGKHDVTAEELKGAAGAMDRTEADAQGVANQVRDLLDYAAQSPVIEVNPDTNEVVSPDTSNLTSEAAQERMRKFTDVEARVAKALADGAVVDSELAQAISKATGVPDAVSHPTSLEDLLLPGFSQSPLKPGEVRNLGPVAGTGAYPGVPGVKGADLGEIVTLPNGTKVAILGDSYADPRVGGPGNTHYPSVAVPVTFDKNGKPVFGPPLTGTNLNSGLPNESPGPHTLFPLPDAARAAGANNALPAGSVTIGKDTYMMVVGTNTNEGLTPKGSWLVKVTNDPSAGWKALDGSYKPAALIDNPNAGQPYEPPRISDPDKWPTQISGYQGTDGKVYIAADGFDRHQGITMYTVDPAQIADRDAWQPWTGDGWGQAGENSAQQAVPLSRDSYGEISFREVDGRPVLSGFNAGAGNTEVHVGSALPTEIFDSGHGQTTVVAAGGQWGEPGKVPQNYGGYIMPGATLDNMGILVSQEELSIPVDRGVSGDLRSGR